MSIAVKLAGLSLYFGSDKIKKCKKIVLDAVR
jgi:hypothetical protein